MRFPGQQSLRAGLGALALASVTTAQSPLFDLEGDQVGGGLGQAVAGAGDVNADGFDDFILGAPTSFTVGSNAGLARVYSGSSGVVLYEVRGANAFDFLGSAVSGAGDVNKDGHDDFVIGIRGDDTNGLNAGAASVYSGMDGSLLYTVYGDQTGDALGSSVSNAGDVDKDSYDDFIVGMPNSDRFAFDGGAARIFSGRSGAVLYTYYGLEDGDSYGTAVGAAGDVDGDGYDDVIASAINGLVGEVSVISGKNGKRLLFLEGDPLGDAFGRSVAGVGDADGDGHDDFLVGAPLSSLNAPAAGAAYLFSGLDGGLIRFYTGDSQADLLGFSVCSAGDVNGDGYDDHVIGAPGRDFDPSAAFPSLPSGLEVGEVNVHSGRTGNLFYSVRGRQAGDLFGWSAASIGDANRDGNLDFVVGAILGDRTLRDSGTAQVLSGTELGLVSDVHEISLSAGGTQILRAHTERTNAGSNYWFIGGASGTYPGIPTVAGTLPLNYDFYVQFSVSHPMGQALKHATGMLDANGNGQCEFVVPPLSDPKLVGLTLHHAYGLIDSEGNIYYHSNAVPVTLVD